MVLPSSHLLLRLSRRHRRCQWHHHILHGLLQLLSCTRMLLLQDAFFLRSRPLTALLPCCFDRGWGGLAQQGGQHREPILRWRSLIVSRSDCVHFDREHGQKVDRRCLGAGVSRAGHVTVMILINDSVSNYFFVFSSTNRTTSCLIDLLILDQLLERRPDTWGQIRLWLKSRVWGCSYLIMTGSWLLEIEEAGLAWSALLTRCQRGSSIA